jgi:predicted metal-dependent hydrolase
MEYGGSLYYKGTKFPIKFTDSKPRFEDCTFFIPPDCNGTPDKNEAVKLYRKLAARDLTRQTLESARLMGVVPSFVRINSAKTRWGSCTAKGGINYSWRLIMADEKSIEYVIIHELSHIIEFNHSENFWKTVTAFIPDCKIRRQHLKNIQAAIEAVGI